MKLLDVLLLTAVLGAAVFSGIRVYGNRGEKPRIIIESPSGTWVYGLDRDISVDIPGALGDSTIEIRDGKARIVKSPCPNQTCIAAPGIFRSGEWNACLPNKVIIRVDTGKKEKRDEIDAFSE